MNVKLVLLFCESETVLRSFGDKLRRKAETRWPVVRSRPPETWLRCVHCCWALWLLRRLPLERRGGGWPWTREGRRGVSLTTRSVWSTSRPHSRVRSPETPLMRSRSRLWMGGSPTSPVLWRDRWSSTPSPTSPGFWRLCGAPSLRCAAWWTVCRRARACCSCLWTTPRSPTRCGWESSCSEPPSAGDPTVNALKKLYW